LRDMLAPKPSSQPAASVTDAVGSLAVRSVTGMLARAQRTLNGANAVWLGEPRF